MTRGICITAWLGLLAPFLFLGVPARALESSYAFPAGIGKGGAARTGAEPREMFPELWLAAAGGGATPAVPGAPGTPATPADPPSHSRAGGGDGPAAADGGYSGGGLRDARIQNVLRTAGGQPEVVITASAADAARLAALGPRLGLKLLRRRTLGRLGISMLVVQMPSWQSIEDLRAKLRREGLSVSADYNALYRPAGGARLYAAKMVTSEHLGTCRLKRPIRIGVVDGTVNVDSPALQGAKVSVDHPGTIATGRASDHATDVISLIAAQPGDGRIPGLLPQAHIFAAAAVKTHRGHQVASVGDIVDALEWMVQNRVKVINMSLAGPRNSVLQAVIGQVARLEPIMVAAVGNDQQGTVSYPASDPHVFAITAVDALKRRYAKANYGPQVDFAAPGVDIYLPSRSGYAYRSGTSYASAIATAVVALDLADGLHGRDEIALSLAKSAEDLGAPGRDKLFGWGLIQGKKCNPF